MESVGANTELVAASESPSVLLPQLKSTLAGIRDVFGKWAGPLLVAGGALASPFLPPKARAEERGDTFRSHPEITHVLEGTQEGTQAILGDLPPAVQRELAQMPTDLTPSPNQPLILWHPAQVTYSIVDVIREQWGTKFLSMLLTSPDPARREEMANLARWKEELASETFETRRNAKRHILAHIRKYTRNDQEYPFAGYLLPTGMDLDQKLQLQS